MLNRLDGPLRIGLLFGMLGIVLTVVGIVRGNVPPTPGSIGMALLIGGGSWFLVAWAVATAAADVERDVAEAARQEEHRQAEGNVEKEAAP